MKARKFYVVWSGRSTGVFSTWEECRSVVEGFQGAKYKAYPTEIQAVEAFRDGYRPTPKIPAARRLSENAPAPNLMSIAVDAACSGNPGKMEYRGVFADTGTELFHQGVFDDATNNIGEFLAIVHGLAYLKKHNLNYPLYSDSANAIAWVKAGRCRTKLSLTKKNEKVFELIARAENWLSQNKFSTQILKWETALWGEIPADFGRK